MNPPILRLDTMIEEVMVNGAIQSLRQGFTTGTTASAAAKAALLALFTGNEQPEVEVPLPAGRRAVLPVLRIESIPGGVTAVVVKNGGDDPDATHGAEVVATVRPHYDGIVLVGGQGVGRVTRAGLALPVGADAINPVPQRMIRASAAEVLQRLDISQGAWVEIAMPDGQRIALDTWNPRVGIEGGLSILGSTGIVRPYSLSAWRASVIQAIRVVAASGDDTLVLCPGVESRRAAVGLYPELRPDVFIDIGGFLGEALSVIGRDLRIRRLCLVGMMGKMSKISQGAMALSARDSSINIEQLAQLAQDAGCDARTVQIVREAHTARDVGVRVAKTSDRKRFFSTLTQKVCQVIAERLVRPVHIEVLIMSPEGRVWGRETHE